MTDTPNAHDQDQDQDQDQDGTANIAEFLRSAADNGGLIMAGTFALYGTPEGGAVLVIEAKEGVNQGVHRLPLRPGMIRMVDGLMQGKGKLAFMGRMFGR